MLLGLAELEVGAIGVEAEAEAEAEAEVVIWGVDMARFLSVSVGAGLAI